MKNKYYAKKHLLPEIKIRLDECILRYMITGAEWVQKTGESGQDYVAKYIYIKPGMFEKSFKVSNVDAVLAVYETRGIHLEKLAGKSNVLVISASDVNRLSEEQSEFLANTAMALGNMTHCREQIVKMVLSKRNARQKHI